MVSAIQNVSDQTPEQNSIFNEITGVVEITTFVSGILLGTHYGTRIRGREIYAVTFEDYKNLVYENTPSIRSLPERTMNCFWSAIGRGS